MSRLRLLAGLGLATLLVFGGITGCPAGGNGDPNGAANGDPNGTANADPNDTGSGDPNDADDNGDATAVAILADHVAAAHFEDIPSAWLAQAKADYRVFYGHTSHGSQVVTGMNMVDSGPGELSLQENGDVDLGTNGDLGWVDITRAVLDEAGSEINLVIWSWCGGVSENTVAGIDAYLNAMDDLEQDYPAVVFVYMTGHLDGSGTGGTLYAGNNQIRAYCQDHDKILYDFADIESYDPAGNYYPNGSDACEWCADWCTSHTCPGCADCQHSECFNCYQKGRAFWWLLARIAGWNGSASDTTPDDDADASDDGTAAAARLQPADLTYQGAFRLPDGFNWGAHGLSYYPGGAGGAGSLFVTGFELLSDPAHPGESCYDPSWNCSAYFGEVAIPTPAAAANWEDLPVATLSTPLTAFDGGLAATVHREYVYVSDIEYVPRRGTQTSDKLYGSLSLWYAEGVAGTDTFPTVWFSNLDGTAAQGMFHVGPQETPYHGRKMGVYLFTVPTWYADQYLGGRTLVTGRSRGTPATLDEITTTGGSQGPTLFAFHAWDSDTPTGNLDALPMLYYRVLFPGCAGPNVGDPDQCDYPNFTMCDDWTGAAFVDNGSRRAIMLLGYKGLGESCYDEPPVDCHDPCGAAHGYHCQPYERQVIFYDVEQLGQVALGHDDPWTVLPYTIWRPTEFYLQDDPCWNAGGMAFDATGERLFMVERGLGESELNAAVVHVWSV